MCGVAVNQDCSCHKSCEVIGTCCTDYTICEKLNENSIKTKIQNCELSETDSKNNEICSKCKEGFYRKNGLCVAECGIKDKVLKENKICLDTNGMICL